ncbi:MAG: elongation factor G [bacterium (Candidatus Ratteibacteria) CG23_combo_of_CG06-09_8_20_14_all_48_7]|uniref:Elongation factor G n=1 Tax=bacterium (Candidatus Ratteibacteria) CG23_combo_of_CG06-09_8_20_14_all_48_7 TaxID=2014292 RepID=A0A2G9YBN2_9BACT|nr:MAG: elongation factor G [bacterium (Candidatus Ratteibacteria) CG23_combo_of_CG06-09_8_20_14_all_48_7]
MRKIRNIAFLGQGKAGKTTLIEGLLFKAGAITRMGSITEGNTTADFDPEETKRQLSINLALTHLDWKGVRINLIDTPGYADFLGETLSGASAADFAAITIPADSGPAVGADNAWKIVSRRNMPVFLIVTKSESGSPSAVESYVAKLSTKWRIKVIPVTNQPGLTEVAAETDDALLTRYLEQGSLSPEEFRTGLKKAILNRQVCPLFLVSAVKGEGLTEFLNFAAEFLPEYQDLAPVPLAKEGESIARGSDSVYLQVFKSTADPYVGRLSYFKIASGTLIPNTTLINLNRSEKERLGQFFYIQGKKQDSTEKGEPGDILGVAKLSATRTGDTLTVNGQSMPLPVIPFPNSAISVSLLAKEKGSEEKLGSAFSRMVEEDPTIQITRDAETGETILSGLGDLHLEIWVSRIASRFGVEVVKGIPKIAYRETVTTTASDQGKYKRQTGGHGQYGDCWLKIEPLPRGTGFEFVDAIVGGAIPRQYIPSVEKGVREAMLKGALANFPVTDIRVTLYDGTFHDVDSSDIAFQIAGSLAFKKVTGEAKPALLEPIMNVEVTIPSDYVGDAMGDINGRRGKVLNIDSADSENQKISAQIPLAEMANYATSLRSLTSGRGGYQAEFSHYEFVPYQIAEKIIKERQAGKEEK